MIRQPVASISTTLHSGSPISIETLSSTWAARRSNLARRSLVPRVRAQGSDRCLQSDGFRSFLRLPKNDVAAIPRIGTFNGPSTPMSIDADIGIGGARCLEQRGAETKLDQDLFVGLEKFQEDVDQRRLPLIEQSRSCQSSPTLLNN